MACDDPELFLDKKWRTTKKKHHHQHYTFDEEITHSQNPNNPSSSSKKSFIRSLSLKNPKPSSSSPPNNPSGLRRSSSTHIQNQNHNHQSPDKSPPLMRSLSRKGSAFTRKCTSLAREQKARFYIMRRCVSMLVRWSKHRDS